MHSEDQAGGDRPPLERDLGEQPLAAILAAKQLTAKDLVAASAQGLTFKMVSRGCKGRRLTPNVKAKLVAALNAATGDEYKPKQLFTY
ncbi:MAG: hypothetical protein P1V81_09545 [Planctomycetota bacterium]|nr:hypothetical protein [Planctomycetota bacterium]